jgi:FkbM family methyltransferase
MTLDEIRKSFLGGEIAKPEYIDRMHERHAVLFDYAAWLAKTDVASIEITDGNVVMTSRADGVRIVCDAADKRIAPIEILNFMEYEKTDSDMIVRLVRDGDRVLDIGANIGWYSITLAKRFPKADIHAFEPIPRTYASLARNVALNGVKNVTLHNFGFSNKTEELTFYYYPSGSVNASSAKLADVEGLQEVRARVVLLDDFIGGGQKTVDFIKCDVEGAELLVFQGATETLRGNRPIVFSEMLRKWSAKFNYHPNDIIGLFRDLGYRCFTAKGGRLAEFLVMDDDTVETNFFFLHGEKHAETIASLG